MRANKQIGLIRTLLIIVVGILLLSYFRVDIRNLIENKLTQENLNYLWGLAKTVWLWISSHLTNLLNR